MVDFRRMEGCVRVVGDGRIELAPSFVMPARIKKDVVYDFLNLDMRRRLIIQVHGKKILDTSGYKQTTK
jgi:hypothetical protein